MLLLVYVDDILSSGDDEGQVFTSIGQLKEKFETVDLGDATFLLGMGIQRDVNTGTIIVPQEWRMHARRRHQLRQDRYLLVESRYRTSSFSGLPQVLLVTSAGARGRTSLTR